MEGFEISDHRFRHYILDNASLEVLASGFRWLEGPVWMGDAGCLLFQDIPNNRTMRWTEGLGVSIYHTVKLRQWTNQRSQRASDRVLASRPLPLPHGI